MPARPCCPERSRGAVWSAERGPVVNRIDPRTGRSATAVTGGGNGLASTGNALWIADTAGGRLYRISR